MVSTSRAARELGLHPRTLQGWARDGAVTPAYVTPGGHYKWDVADLRRQLQRREGSAGDQDQDQDNPAVAADPADPYGAVHSA